MGTASQPKRNAAVRATRLRIKNGIPFFKLKWVNFNAIIGNLETIRKLTKKMVPYQNHLFIKS